MGRRTMIPPVLVIAAFSLALLTAVIASMTGLGGGFLYVPLLTIVFGLDPTVAVGTSLIVIIFTTVSASVSYLAQGRVFFRSALWLIVPSVGAAIIGALSTAVLPGVLVAAIFAAIVGILAVTLLFPSLPLGLLIAQGPSREEVCNDRFCLTVRNRIYYLHYVVWGTCAGLASGLIGIGGGVINVPAMVASGMPVHFATATSSFVVLCTAVAGGGIHAALGQIDPVYAVTFSAGAILGGAIGAGLAPRAPADILRKGTGILFGAISIAMAIHILL